MVREEFRLLRKQRRVWLLEDPFASERLQLTTFLGGSDPHGRVVKLGQLIAHVNARFAVTFITDDRNATALAKIPHPPYQTWHTQAPTGKLADSLATTHVAVVAAGTSLNDVIGAGLPPMMIKVAENQSQNYRTAQELGLAVPLGELNRLNLDTGAAPKIASFLKRPNRLQEMVEAGSRVIDGEGASRVADAIDALASRIRKTF
jgi:spore coat polysaccharide biosynthesis predicted glycosyltransferase SpsG